MRHELFLYWRTSPADLPAAKVAMQAFQQSQSLAESGLHARLLVRADEAADHVTLMETYTMPATAGGVGDMLRQRIVELGNAASAPWRAGARHLEVFSEIDPAECTTRSAPAR